MGCYALMSDNSGLVFGGFRSTIPSDDAPYVAFHKEDARAVVASNRRLPHRLRLFANSHRIPSAAMT